MLKGSQDYTTIHKQLWCALRHATWKGSMWRIEKKSSLIFRSWGLTNINPKQVLSKFWMADINPIDSRNKLDPCLSERCQMCKVWRKWGYSIQTQGDHGSESKEKNGAQLIYGIGDWQEHKWFKINKACGGIIRKSLHKVQWEQIIKQRRLNDGASGIRCEIGLGAVCMIDSQKAESNLQKELPIT